MQAVELKKPSTPVIKAMQERGVLVLPGGGTVIRFLPSILIEDAQLDEGIAELAAWLEGRTAEDRVDDAARELTRRGLAL